MVKQRQELPENTFALESNASRFDTARLLLDVTQKN
jgi:hypothetical protein